MMGKAGGRRSSLAEASVRRSGRRSGEGQGEAGVDDSPLDWMGSRGGRSR
jgi:hypothetical protein